VQPAPRIRPYPWDALEPIARDTVSAARVVRQIFAERMTLGEFARGLEQVVGGSVEIAFGRYLDPSSVDQSPGALHFQSSDDSFAVSISADAQLADVLLSKLLGQKAGLAKGDAASNPALRGALSRIVVEAWRSSGARAALVTSSDQRARSALAALGVGGTLIYDDKPYAVSASIRALRLPEPSEVPTSLRALARVPLRAGLVATACTATRAELDGLGVGDAFLPGGDWCWTKERGGRLAIVDSSQKSGAFFFEPLDDRSAKLCRSDDDFSGGGSLMAEDEDKTVPGSSLQAVLDAPLVVHVEVATVTLSGRAWAELKPGDVIRTDQRLGEAATLRIAGRALAKGELVNVEGELGVRIRRLVDEESDGQ